jgi:hypothetical protein
MVFWVYGVLATIGLGVLFEQAEEADMRGHL